MSRGRTKTRYGTALRRAVVLEPLSNQLDTDTLERHGRVTTMFGAAGCAHQTPSIMQTEFFRGAVRRWLETNGFDEEDLFVVSGRMAKVALALAYVMEWATERKFPLSVLLYDGQSQGYVERQL